MTKPTESLNWSSKESVGLKLVGFQYPETLNFTSESSKILDKFVEIVSWVTLFKVKQEMFTFRDVIPVQTGERGAVTVSGTVIEIKSPLIKGDAGTIEKV